MKVIIKQTDKTCGSCQYWSGDRTPGPYSGQVSLDDKARGKCTSRKSQYFNWDQSHISSCPQSYEKWEKV